MVKLIIASILLMLLFGCILIVGDKNKLATTQERTIGISVDEIVPIGK